MREGKKVKWISNPISSHTNASSLPPMCLQDCSTITSEKAPFSSQAFHSL